MLVLFKTDLVKFIIEDVSLTQLGIDKLSEETLRDNNQNVEFFGFEDNSLEYVIHTTANLEEPLIGYIANKFTNVLRANGFNKVTLIVDKVEETLEQPQL